MNAPPKPASLSGEHVLVTGGSRGIGLAIAQQLSSLGAIVTIVARDVEVARRAAAGLPGQAAAVSADVTESEQVAEAIASAESEQGEVTILVNNVGAADTAPFLRTTEAQWDRMFEINFLPVRLCCQRVLPHMLAKGAGRIVNVASTAGLRGFAYVAAYVAAKHAAVGLTRALAMETAERGVGVAGVCPGFVDTEMTRESARRVAQRTGRPVAEVLSSYAASNGHQRLLQPEEVADAVVSLCCEDPAVMNGRVVTIDGSDSPP